MKIQSYFKVYDVDFIDRLDEVSRWAEDGKSFFVIDQKVYGLYRAHFAAIPEDRLFLLEALEQNKTIDTALAICERMTALSAKRNAHLISIGGGITQDVTGFVANVLYRGICWTFYPSTLLAACDSCIGGKTSLNYKGFKNLLGTFYPPDNIRIYTQFFHTLSEGDYYSGLGEVVKFNVMAGADGIDTIETAMPRLLARDPAVLARFVKRSLEFKKGFIEEDEFDKGVRILLNFAHTFGHAFEVSSAYKIPHGTAVALGMIVANHISESRGLLEPDFAKRIEAVCRRIIPDNIERDWFAPDIIFSAIRKDKKQTSEAIRAVLMRQDLSLQVFDDLSTDEINAAIAYLVAHFIDKAEG